MSNVQLSAERTPHDLGRFVFTCGDIGRLKVIDSTPVFPGDSYEANMVGAIRLSPLRRGLAIDSKVDICSFYIPHRHTYGDEWVRFLQDGPNAKPLSTVQVSTELWGAGFAGCIPNSVNSRIPKWLFEGYRRIYNNYFCLPEILQSSGGLPPDPLTWSHVDMHHGAAVAHLKNVWTAPLPQDVSTESTLDVSGGSLDIMNLNLAYGKLHTEQEREMFMTRYRDIMDKFGGKTHYDADQRPHMLMRSEFWASGYDVDGTDSASLGQFSGRVQQSFNHRVPRFFVPEHGAIITVAVMRFPPIHLRATPYYIGKPDHNYFDFAGDPAIDGNMPPREISCAEIFRDGSTTNHLKLSHAQWFRSIPDYVDPLYGYLEGFPFINNLPTSSFEASMIGSTDYEHCFQTMQLRHWNAQIKTNVTVLRSLPSARESILTNA